MKPLLIIAILLAAFPASAEVCTQDLTCETLGYIESKCDYGGVACPYDNTKWLCAKWTCADGRYYEKDEINEKTDTLMCTEDEYQKLSCFEKEEFDKKNNLLICTETQYKGLTCFDCIKGCEKTEYDLDLCNDKFVDMMEETCTSLGFVNTKEECENYVSCPSNYEKVRCLD